MNTAPSPHLLLTRKTALLRRPTLRGPSARHGLLRPVFARVVPGELAHAAQHAAGIESPSLAKGDDHEFLQLLAAYRASGGLAPGAEIAARQPGGGISGLGRLIAAKKVLSFEWSATTWLPVFQFQSGQIALREGVREVLEALSCPALDGWDMAQWFVQPSGLLAGAAPLALLGADTPAVIEAARAYRFILRG